MTARLRAGFDYFPLGAAEDHLAMLGWSGAINDWTTVAPGRYGFGRRLQILPNTGGPHQAYAPIPVDIVTGFVGVALNIGDDNGGGLQEQMWVGLFDGSSGTMQLCVGLEHYGIVRARLGGPAGAVLGETRPAAFFYGRDLQLEIGSKIDADGHVEVRINTVTVIDVPSTDTVVGPNAWWNMLALIGADQQSRCHVDDLYVNDDAGAVNNTFLGQTRVQGALVSGPGDEDDFTGSNGALANWQCALNELVDDSLFTASPTVGDGSLWAVTPLVNNPTVFDVQVVGFYRQTDATQRFVKNQLKVGGTLVRGDSTATYQLYAGVTFIQELSPATGIGLTGAEVNGAQIGPYVDA